MLLSVGWYAGYYGSVARCAEHWYWLRLCGASRLFGVIRPMLRAAEALERLQAGNARFQSDCSSHAVHITQARRRELARGQAPFAVILGCADSRVPAELVFDQGLGDLFVIRVAGNVAAPSQVGSVEFAVDQFGTRLVVVLGHSKCGAVKATLDELRRPSGNPSRNLASIVERIRPGVAGLLELHGDNEEHLVGAAVRANIEASVEQLRSGSDILAGLTDNDGLKIVGAEYSLETGAVEFFE